MKYLLVLFILSPSLILSQSRSSKSELLGKFGDVKLEYVEVTGDYSFNSISMSFQNAAYNHIIDIGVILLSSISNVEEFVKILKEAIAKFGSGELSSWNFGSKNKIVVFQSGKTIAFYSGKKKTYLKPKKAQLMLDAIEANKSRLE